MLITLLTWMVTSFVCWVWGHAFLNLLCSGSQKKLPHFSVVCFTGLAVLATVSTYISLFTKINDLVLIIVFALAILLLISKKWGIVLKQHLQQCLPTSFPFLLLLIVSSLLVLVMSVWHILHPDTVEYHAAIISSIKEQGLITGYANEHIRYGLQSNWFITCALFSFDAISPLSLTFANSVVLFWLLLFVTGKIAAHNQSQRGLHAFLYLIFLFFLFWDYTQIRLTSTSASPDFMATLYILLAIYYFIRELKKETYFLILLFCATAVTIKLSSFPIALLVFYLLTLSRNQKWLVPSLLLLLIIISSFLLRNYYTSGYPFFPAIVFQLPAPSWKLDASQVQQIQHYITAYARTASSAETDAVSKTLALSFSEWLPIWWRLRSVAQQAIILCSFVTVLVGISKAKTIFHTVTNNQRISLGITLIGLITWFMLAPDPRFGIAWLLLLNVLVLQTVITVYKVPWLHNRIMFSVSYLLSAGLFVYLVYRLMYFFDSINWIFPYGLK